MSFPQQARDISAAGAGGAKESYLDLKDGHVAEFQVLSISPSVVTAQGSDGGEFKKLPMKIRLFRWDFKNERTGICSPFTNDLGVVENWSPAIDSGHINDLIAMDERLKSESGDSNALYKRRVRVEVQKVGRYNRHTYTDLGPVDGAAQSFHGAPAAPAAPTVAPPTPPAPGVAPPPPVPSSDPVATLRTALDGAKTASDVKTAAASLWPSIPPHRASEATKLVTDAQRRVALAAINGATTMDLLGSAWNAVSPGIANDGEGMALITAAYQSRAVAIQTGNADVPF